MPAARRPVSAWRRRWHQLSGLLPLVMVAAASLALILLYLVSRTPHHPALQAIEVHLARAELARAQLFHDLLRVRSGLLPRYDEINADQDRLEAELSALGRFGTELPDSPGLSNYQRIVSGIEASWPEWRRRLDDFKRHHSVASNSIYYLASRSSEASPNLESAALRARLSEAVLGLITRPGSDERALQAVTRQLRDAATAPAPDTTLTHLLRHAEVIERHLQAMDTTMLALQDGSLQAAIDGLRAAYQTYLADAQTIARRAQVAIFVFAVGLLIYLFDRLVVLRRNARELRREVSERRQAEEALAASEQRLRLALRASQHILWDLDMVRDRVVFGPEVVEVFGELPATVGASEAWFNRVHPDDQDDLREAWISHLKGETELFEIEHRVRGPGDKGVYHWMQARGQVVRRDDQGRALRALGTLSHLSEWRHAERELRRLIEATASTGEAFFADLCRHLADTLGVRFAMVAETLGDDRARLLAAVDQGRPLPAQEYDLRHSPCAQTIRQQLCIYPQQVRQRFPDDDILQQLGMEAYIGVSMQDGRGRPLGLIALMHDQPLSDTSRARSLLSLFAGRAAAELQGLRSELALARETEQALVTLYAIGEGVIVLGIDGRVERINPAAQELLGCSAEAALGRPLESIYPVTDLETGSPLPLPLVPGTRESCRRDGLGLQRPDGRQFALEDCHTSIAGPDGRRWGSVLVIRDVTRARQLADQLAHQARHDGLTGLVNRREFERRLTHAVERAQRQGAEHVLCYLDLDNFKLVNDTCGHHVGDELLRQVTAIFARHIRERDTLARLGGDEFGLLLENCPLDKAYAIASLLLSEVQDWRFLWEGKTFEVGVSIGLVPVRRDAGGVTELLQQADIACYAAKDLGRNRIHVHHVEDLALQQRRRDLNWAAELSRAVDQDRFQLYWQPIVPLAGEPCGEHHEVLLRLVSEADELVLPGQFIPAAERYNLMGAIDRWVIRHALARFARLGLGSGGTGLPPLLSLNISGVSLNDPGLSDYIRGQLRHWEIDPTRLCFEITETAAIRNLTESGRFLQELKALGCRLALDDFGSGLSSFSYLKQLPVDCLKIDGSFVRNMASDPIDRAMVAVIAELGHLMGMTIIAEYVENADVARCLREVGVDQGQGYHFSAPVEMPRLPAQRPDTQPPAPG